MFFGIGQITITRNSEFCFQSENLRHEKNSELSFFGIGQVTITRNSDFAFKVKISRRKKFRVIVFRYRANNDNLELGFCFQSENLT